MTNAIATLLFTQSYLPGVIVLGKTLRQDLPPDTKLVVLLATQLTPFQINALQEVYDEIIDTPLIHAPVSKELILLDRPELSPTYSKINLFKLTQFNTVLYLDADTLPLKSIAAELFEQYGDIASSQIVAVPDSGWPDIFNSGLFLFKPSIDTYLSLLNKIQHTDNPSFDGADQGLLNQYFHLDEQASTTTEQVGWIKLPFLYNVTPTGQYEYQPAYNYFQDQIRLVHFIGNVKPWENSYDSSGLKSRWWDRFYEFYGQGATVTEKIHGITPVYYVPTEELENLTIEPEKDTQYEKANEFLLDPKSYELFKTIQPDDTQWNPAIEAPPKTGVAEASRFPHDLSYYSSWSDANNEGEIELHDSQESSLPPIFPWEFERNQIRPERTFDNNGTIYGDNAWTDLPLIKKIQDKLKEEAERKSQVVRTVEEELEEKEYLADEKERLKEIEKRYIGGIPETSEELETKEGLETVEEQKSSITPKVQDNQLENI